VDSGEVVHLATLPKTEREKVLAEKHRRDKDFACNAVKSYMDAMQVSRDELIQYLTRGTSRPSPDARMPPGAVPPSQGRACIAPRRHSEDEEDASPPRRETGAK
jgi:hypothetical protein